MPKNTDGSFNWAKALNIAISIGGGALEMPVLQGVRDVLTGAYSTERIALGALGLLLEAPTQVIPGASLLRQISSATDPYVRSTAPDGKGAAKAVGGFTNSLKMLTPWGRQSLPVKYDALGRPMQNTAADSGLGRLGNAMFNPFNTYKANDTAVTREIDRLRQESGSNSILPQTSPTTITSGSTDYRLTSAEKQTWQKTQGQTLNETMVQLMQSDTYKNASDTERVKLMICLADASRETAKAKYLESKGAAYEGTAEKLDSLKAEGVPYAKSIIYYAKLRSLQTVGEKWLVLYNATDIDANTKEKLSNVLLGKDNGIQRNWQTFKDAGYTPEQYARVYAIAGSNEKNKEESINELMGKYGWSESEATAVYEAATKRK
ncbi:MAG: hypothetical protein RR387_06215 [Clostridiales bacterium]